MGRELGMLELRMFTVGVLRAFDIEWTCEPSQVNIKMFWIMEMFNVEMRFKEIVREEECIIPLLS